MLDFLELYDYCLNENIADKNLIAKWKKQGYENLCCLRCIQTRDTNFGTTCICRVPKAKLEEVSINLIFIASFKTFVHVQFYERKSEAHTYNYFKKFRTCSALLLDGNALVITVVLKFV